MPNMDIIKEKLNEIDEIESKKDEIFSDIMKELAIFAKKFSELRV